MPAIRLLPEAVVNRIAAGEVVERPAAAVKELVENALDAGARRIAVAIAGGGVERIEVSDEGCGMNAAELALAVQRHATSKLHDDDLGRIATLGFRGEALAAIGAAARLSITSRPHDAAQAHAITVEAGRVSAPRPAAGAPGTRVVVRDLFFATPARRKFLKQPRTEAEQAELALRRLALAAPGAAFRLEIDGRTVFDLPPQDRAARLASLLGVEVAAALVPVEAARDGVALSGFAGSPALTRATTAHQIFTVNGRPVADPLLKGAVRGAYRQVIEAGRHPVVALWLDLPAETGRCERPSRQGRAALPRPGRGACAGRGRHRPGAGRRRRRGDAGGTPGIRPGPGAQPHPSAGGLANAVAGPRRGAVADHPASRRPTGRRSAKG